MMGVAISGLATALLPFEDLLTLQCNSPWHGMRGAGCAQPKPLTKLQYHSFFPTPSVSGLVEEDVPRLRILGDVRRQAVELLNCLGINFLHNVVIKQKPEAVALHYGDVVATIWATAAVHHHGHQVVHAIGVGGVARGVEESQLQGEDHAVGQLGVAVQLVHVLKPLQVQSQNHGQLLHPHPFLCFLLASTLLTVVLIFAT